MIFTEHVSIVRDGLASLVANWNISCSSVYCTRTCSTGFEIISYWMTYVVMLYYTIALLAGRHAVIIHHNHRQTCDAVKMAAGIRRGKICENEKKKKKNAKVKTTGISLMRGNPMQMQAFCLASKSNPTSTTTDNTWIESHNPMFRSSNHNLKGKKKHESSPIGS